MKLESDRWKLEAVEVDDAEELFWPSSSARYHSIDHSASSQRVIAHRRFGCHRNLVSLKQLTLETFLYQLIELCQQKNYGEKKRALKHYLKFLLPSLLRQQLLDLSTKDNRIYTLVDMNIFELLLSPSVKCISINSVRSFFRQPFVNSLRSLGSGLEELIIHDSSWLQRRECLPSALSRMTHLRRVSLRYLANDMMLAALAKNCHRLEEIDVSYSIDITDAGVRVLCDPDQPIAQQETPHPANGQAGQRYRKISAPESSTTFSGCMVWFPRLVRGMRRYSVIEQQANREPIFPNYHEEDTPSVKWSEKDNDDSASLDEEEALKSCIESLLRLDLIGTSVTPSGLQMILAASSKLSVMF